MASLTFADQVSEWVEAVEGATEAVFREAVQDLFETAQTPVGAGGRLPLDTGYLRASFQVSTTAMPPISTSARPANGQSYSYTGQEVTAVLATAQLGVTVFGGYTASYAPFVEFGARGRAPAAFVRTAAQRWPQIVRSKETEVQSRLGLG